jgi:16S rRNA (cytosine1402-N4)-methyltransferase
MAHISVLLNETLAALIPEGRPVERAIDGTLGAGGHTRAMLERGAKTVLGLDLDPQALALAKENLAPFGERAVIVHASYTTMDDEAARLGWDGVDAILLDLGVSSMQLDTAERGFAFMREGPLDMRFDPSGDRVPASEIINLWSESELANLFYQYGEEPDSRRFARAIIAGRPFTTTQSLADAIKQAAPHPKKKKGDHKTIHPATRIFQALRIAVNDELGVIERTVPTAIDLLRPGGRLVVISFHSLEDRIVKQTFKNAATEIISPPGMVLQEKQAVVKLITRKPIIASDQEITENPRSRSAKLRVVEKL